MAKIGLFFGSQTGNTETAAELIQREFGSTWVDLINIADADLEDLMGYDYLILGCSTWNVGELQSDWDEFFPNFDDMNFEGKKVAYFGMGDQLGYPDNFQDAIGILAEKVAEQGGINVGAWPTDGYNFSESKALVNGTFVGLALDEDNQSDLTKTRIREWIVMLKNQFGL